MNIEDHLEHQFHWSSITFGPPRGPAGVIDHLKQEMIELEAEPYDLEEWIDVIILACDGAWRAGFTTQQILEKWQYKQNKNEARKWPDWKLSVPGKAINHIKEHADLK